MRYLRYRQNEKQMMIAFEELQGGVAIAISIRNTYMYTYVYVYNTCAYEYTEIAVSYSRMRIE